ncbi:hypothetical protein TVAG_356060 [Trichomonas vaginalis G3]|uniref:Uncharacterized protein n=1 Tax=Trichomonas vaginalis (strain ATCC PRA-98 / G3) TaxID=412133 RepID=A2FK48_TRIV3|nr:hypothetical protein TVAGG3_0020410 [Trichomonas vaginalis G3]EAX94727.1 hypothetical protein TVAG_356060 [Trichomonas vaginalis G3]KAI5539636.1 hypothetical protein TVAGG3_0020410 [Trichomonas vaginalis G3]|eukprot:XP_001307657.1 hypothetical protein [Trichomonas vaginalis G3]
MNESKGKSPLTSRSNLTKIRGLQDVESIPKKTNKQDSLLPNGWFYDETKQEDFWKDMENERNPINMESLELQNKKTENINNIGDSSKKINSILKSFDNIDEDVLVQMLEISPEMNQNGDVNTDAILDSTKTQVIQYCQDMLDVKKSQDTLFGSLKKWFQVLEKNELFYKKEYENTQDEPDIQEVFMQFDQIMSELSTNSEKITYIHHDITDTWQKQAVALKKEVIQKDIQIHQLTESIEQLNQLNKRNAKNKKLQNEKLKENEIKQSMLDNYIKQVEEQKNQITKLKQQLLNLEASRAANSVNFNSTPSSFDPNQTNVDQIKLECEAKVTMLKQRIQQLEEESQTFNNKIQAERQIQKTIEKESNLKTKKIEEMEQALHKYIELLQLEKENNMNNQKIQPKEEKNDVNVDDLYLQIAQLKEGNKEIENKYQIEMNNIKEIERQKAAHERQVLIAAMNSKGTEKNEIIQEIVKNYDKKFETQKQEFDKINTDISKNLGNRISLLTKQYEQRIKDLNEEHTNEMITLQNTLNYNIRKAKIEINEEFNNKLQDFIRRSNEQEGQYKKTIQNLQDNNLNLKNQIKNLSEFIEKVTGEQPKISLTEELHVTKSLDLTSDLESKYMEEYLQKIKNEKEILQENYEWQIKQNKLYYEDLLKKELQKNAAEQKALLKNVIDSLSTVKMEGENQLTISKAIDDASNGLVKLNETEMTKVDTKEMIPVEESNKRIKIFTDRISQLTLQLNDKNDYSKEIERLNKKVAFLENLKKGNKNQDEFLQKMNEMEQSLREELREKDELIKEMQRSEELRGLFYGDMFDTEIFSHSPVDEYITLTKNETITRSQPEIILKQETDSSPLVKTKSNEVLIKEEVIEKKFVPAKIKVVKDDETKKEIRTIAVVKNQEKEVVKEIDDKTPIKPSDLIDTKVTVKVKKERPKLEISDVLFSLHKPRRYELFIAPGSRMVRPKITYSELFGLIPGKKPPLMVLSDDWSKTVLDNLQTTLKNILLAQKGVADDDKAKEDFLGTMKVALIDSNDRIIVNDKDFVTRIDKRIEEMNKEQSEAKQKTDSLSSEAIKPTNEVPFMEDNSYIYERPAPEPLNLDLDIKEIDLEGDTFTSSVNVCSEIIRFVSRYKENEQYIKNVLDGDLSAFEIYLTNHFKEFDQVCHNFLKNCLESNNCYSKNITQANDLQSLLMKLLKLCQVSKKKNISLQQKVTNYEATLQQQTIQIQEGLIDKLKDQSEKTNNEEVDKMMKINKINGILEAIDSFGLDFNENEVTKLETLKQKVSQQEDVDNLLDETETLIKEIKPLFLKKEKINMENEMTKVTDLNQVLDHKYKKYKHGYMEVINELKQVKVKNQNLEKRILALNDKIKEEQTSTENSISFYKTQLNTLNRIFENLTDEKIKENFSKTPSEITEMILKQINDMKSLINLNKIENENLKKLNEQKSAQNSDFEEIQLLKEKIQVLEEENKNLTSLQQKSDRQALFHELDLDKMRKENECEQTLSQNQKKQIDEILSENQNLRNEILEKDKNLQQLKFTLRQKDDQIDELNIRIVLGAYHDTKTRISEGIQTTLRIISRKSDKNKVANSNQTENPQKDVKFENEPYYYEDVEMDNGQFLRSGGFSSASFTDSSAIFDSVQKSESEKSNTSPLPMSSILANSNDNVNDSMPKFHLNLKTTKSDSQELLHEDSVEWVNCEEENPEIYDKFSEDLIDNSNEKNKVNDITNDSIQINVHKPLNWKISDNEKRKSILEQISDSNKSKIKRPMTSHLQKPRKPSIQLSKGDQDKLMIGEVSPGVRPLKGYTGKVTPPTQFKQILRMKSTPHPQNDLEVSPIKSARIPIDSDKKVTPTPKTSRTSLSEKPKTNTARSNYKMDNEVEVETIRITNVQIEKEDEKNKEKKPPIVSSPSFPQFEKFEKVPLTVRSAQNYNYNREKEINEFKVLIQKLRETISSQKKTIDQNEQLLSELKKKLNEQLSKNQKLQIEIVKSEDKARRSQIRYDNCSQRLEIAMNQISLKEEELQNLKRELNKLKSLTAPTISAFDRMRNAIKEQNKLKKENEMNKKIEDMVNKEMKNSNSNDVQSHLATLLQNTQKSAQRNEAKCRMWRNYEKKQITAALAALSLIDNGDVADKVTQFVLSNDNAKLFDLWSKRNAIKAFENEQQP